jgi:spermidine synthase
MAVVGLGAGTLAAYGRPGDRYTFFEIDPLVVDIATSELFTYIGTSEAEVAIEVVDGRLGLLDSAERFDVVVIDAFSSDAIPVHLMTVEAIAVYLDRLAPNGVLLVHVSNRYFDLRPVLGRAAHELAVSAAVQSFRPSAAESSDHAAASTWIAISASEDRFVSIIADGRWEQLPAEGPLWTDDYSNLLGVIDF